MTEKLFTKAMGQIDFETAFVIDPEHELEDELEIELMKLKIWKWADEHFENAWTKAHERFRGSLSSASPAVAEYETSLYRDTICAFIRKYRETKQKRKVAELLEKAKARQTQPPPEIQEELKLD